jgi:predicted TIM-barrel fold metal-dependent hydrolase
MRTITLEEHFASPAFFAGPGKQLKERASHFGDRAQHLFEQLGDLGDKRLAEMDKAGIDVQVLSLTAPGVEQLDPADAIALARESNDFLAEAIARHPSRFGGFAALPTSSPDQAADELQRRVRNHALQGAVINGHTRGRYLDDKFFSPILESAESLGVPIYLHPTPPPTPVIEASYSGFGPIVTEMLAGPGWGWHVETAVHVIRMILGGVFDRYPKLLIIVGHVGETLPFMIQRLDVMPSAMTKLQRPVSAYLRENLHYTFSGFNYLPNFLQLFLQVGIDRIMFSADHPYASMPQARAFLENLPISPADKDRIAHTNAERLLHLHL